MQRTSLLFISLFFFSSASFSQIDAPVLISLERTKCFGTCPVYKLEIYETNEAILVGEENFDKIGEFYAQMTKSQVKQLVKYVYSF